MPDPANSADDAARALRDVEQRRDQVATAQQESRWVSAVFGVAIFAQISAPDFFGRQTSATVGLVVAALVVVYAVLHHTRRGSTLLGRGGRVRKEAYSPRVVLWLRITLLAMMLVVYFAAPYVHISGLFPYARTAVGAVLGGTLLVFGRSLQRALDSLAIRGNGGGSDGLDGIAHGSR